MTYWRSQLMHMPGGPPATPPPSAAPTFFRSSTTGTVAGEYIGRCLCHASVNQHTYDAFSRLIPAYMLIHFPEEGSYHASPHQNNNADSGISYRRIVREDILPHPLHRPHPCCSRSSPSSAVAGAFAGRCPCHAPDNQIAFNAFGRFLTACIVCALPGIGYLQRLPTSARPRRRWSSPTAASNW